MQQKNRGNNSIAYYLCKYSHFDDLVKKKQAKTGYFLRRRFIPIGLPVALRPAPLTFF